MNTNIESHLVENRVFKPAKSFSRKAHVSSFQQYQELYRKSIKNPEKFFGQQAAELLVWQKKWKVNPDLVARDDEGKAYTVRYEAVNAMLLNEFIKEHRRNETQQQQLDALSAVVKEQAMQIQKVSGQLWAIQAVPRFVSSYLNF